MPSNLIPIIKYRIKAVAIRFLQKLDIDCRRISSLYPIHISLNKIDSIFEIEPYLFRRNVLLKNTPLNRLRCLPFLKWGENSNHPFAVAIKQAHQLPIDQCKNSIEKTLQTFYSTVAPNCLSDLVENNQEAVAPAWTIIMPWESLSLSEWSNMIRQSVILENSLFLSAANINEGWAWLGPISEAKLSIEVSRLYHTLQSILSNGYQRTDMPDGDIYGDLLINTDGDWVIQTIGGQHRAATLSGLAFQLADIRIKSIVRAGNVEHWPHVKSGLYTINQALSIFNHVFIGTSPHAYKLWEANLVKLSPINQHE